jgi:hypothetical protein
MGKTAGRGVEVVETFLEELGKPAKVQITKKEFAFPENGEVQMGSNKKMPNNESEFQNWIRGTDWFKEFKSEYNEEPDLDTKDYDYRAAWKAGVQPERDPYDNNRFHWPSSLPTGKMLKSAEHPTAWKEYFMRETGVNPDALGLKTPEEANIFIENISKGQEKAAGGEVNKGRAASIGGEEFYNAALAAGLPLDNDTLNKIVDLVNAGYSVSKAAQLVKGGSEVHMMGGGRPPKKTTLEEDLKSFKDPAIALADLLAGLGRGTTAAATGIAGDLEELYRQYGKGAVANAVRLMLPKREGKATTFPTIEEMNAMLPPVVPAGAGRSSQVADVGQFFGENNPLAPAAGELGVRAVKAALPLARKAGQAAKKAATSDDLAYALENLESKLGLGPKQIMIGPMSKSWRKDDAKLVELMEYQGKTPEEIWQVTRTFRAPDGRLRQEISDANMKYTANEVEQKQYENARKRYEQAKARATTPEELNDATDYWNKTKADAIYNLSGKAQDFINHPELFAAYPDLAKYSFKQLEQANKQFTAPENTYGFYSPGMQRITINSDLPYKRSTALHELQHAIQDIEGWQSGSSPEYITAKMAERDIAKKEAKEIQDRIDNMRSIDPVLYEDLIRDEQIALSPKKYILNQTQPLEGVTDPYDAYRRMSGEEEARMVQARRDMGLDELIARPPFEDYEADPSQHITKDFATGGAVMMDDGGLTIEEFLRKQGY